MQRPSLRQTSLVLGLGLSLACSSASREAEPDAAASTDEKAATEAEPEGPRGPTLGAPAPALALDSLSGERVQLPLAGSSRASVLIFGSFS